MGALSREFPTPPNKGSCVIYTFKTHDDFLFYCLYHFFSFHLLEIKKKKDQKRSKHVVLSNFFH